MTIKEASDRLTYLSSTYQTFLANCGYDLSLDMDAFATQADASKLHKKAVENWLTEWQRLEKHIEQLSSIKPSVGLPCEVHNPRAVDPERAWQVLRDMCK